MDHVEFDREPPANLTTMVMAFGGWIDAGRAATGALRHLTRDLRAERLARINPEEFFVFTQERPEVRLRADGGRDIEWPLSEFLAWHPGDGRDGLLLFCGPEPHQRWQTYTKAFLDVAERCGVRRIVSLGALLAGAPHTRPVRVTARSNDPAARSLLEALIETWYAAPDEGALRVLEEGCRYARDQSNPLNEHPAALIEPWRLAESIKNLVPGRWRPRLGITVRNGLWPEASLLCSGRVPASLVRLRGAAAAALRRQ